MTTTPSRRARRPMLAVPVLVAGLALVAPTAPAQAADSFAHLTLEQQVGEVFMVGAPATGAGAATTSAIRDRHVGNVILTGRSAAGTSATAAVTGSLRALATPAATGGVGLLI